MAQVTLKPVNAHFELPELVVEINKENWPAIRQDGADMDQFHGIGTLRRMGYDVTNLCGAGTVYRISPKGTEAF